MDRKTIVAMMLCFIIYMGWQKFYIEPYMARTTPISSNSSIEKKDSSFPTQNPIHQTSINPLSPQAKKITPSQTLEVSTSIGTAVLGDLKNFFVDWKLNHYKQDREDHSKNIDLNSVTHLNGGLSIAFDDPEYAYLNDAQGDLIRSGDKALWTYEDSKIKLIKEFYFYSDRPEIDLRISANFKDKQPRYAFLSLLGQGFDKDPDVQDRQLFYWTQNSIERILLKDDVSQKDITTPVKYIGIANRYFLFSLIAQGPSLPNGLIQPMGNRIGRVNLVYPIQGNHLVIPTKVYFGPKDLDLLRKVEPTLDNTVDFGWFTLFAYPILKVLNWLYQFVHNYGVAIILLTLLLKIATFPLTYKSMKSMKRMAKLQPQLQKIRDRYKDDKEALNKETLNLMRSQGYNPMAGCLPMIVQMPIFFALYRVLYGSIELYHAPFALWIQDLSYQDPYYVTPILLTLTMYIQQKMTPNTITDPAQAKMMQFMPIIFGGFMLALPSGLTIYMLVNAVASIGQQVILNKKLED